MMSVLLNKNKKLLRVPSLSAPQRKSDQNMKTVTSSITHKWDKAESLENMERGWWKYDKKQFDKWKLVLCSFLPALFWPWGEGQRDLILKPMTVFWLLLQRYLAFLHFFFSQLRLHLTAFNRTWAWAWTWPKKMSSGKSPLSLWWN